MESYAASNARAKFFQLMDYTADSHEPILITGKRNNAVLISHEDWKSVQETLYLLSIPHMGASIKEGLNTDIGQCSKDIDL